LLLSGEFAYSMQKIRELGFFKQMELHSNTSQYGSMTRGMRFIIPELHDKLRDVLKEITSGDFAKEWTAEQEAGHPTLKQLRELRTMHPMSEWERKTRDAFRMDAVSS
jgi:ketol-acid reductoisomerase